MRDPKLELRNRAHEVQLVVENGQTRPVIGTSEPTEEEDRALQARVRAAQHWGARSSPRQVAQGGITEPLDLRSRTVLAAGLPQEARRVLNEGLPGHGKVPESGVVATVPVKASK
jgi:hypothetical protein